MKTISFEAIINEKDYERPPINKENIAIEKIEEINVSDSINRNHNIVDSVDKMIATPKEYGEVLRSGTWATIRYSKKVKVPIAIVYPDGSIFNI